MDYRLIYDYAILYTDFRSLKHDLYKVRCWDNHI